MATKAKPARRTRTAHKPLALRSTTDPKRSRRDSRSQPLWTGSLRLALVTVPVRSYPAIGGGARISFHQVHQPSGKRIRYQKIVPGIGPVDTDDIVKGFDPGEGQYVLLKNDEIESLKIDAKRTLDLVQFVSQGEIDPIWFERPCYVVPDGELAEEATACCTTHCAQPRNWGSASS